MPQLASKLFLTILLTFTLVQSATTNPLKSTALDVYVCTGEYAYAYHLNPNCAGLNNCKDEIQLMGLQNAIDKGRKMCKREN